MKQSDLSLEASKGGIKLERPAVEHKQMKRTPQYIMRPLNSWATLTLLARLASVRKV